jgi:hypothetical protein
MALNCQWQVSIINVERSDPNTKLQLLLNLLIIIIIVIDMTALYGP